MDTDKKSISRFPFRFFWRNSLTTKLILLCALIVIIPLVYQSVFSVNSIADGMFRQYSAAMRENISNERQLVDNYFSYVRDWPSVITENLSYMNLLSSRGSGHMTQRLRLDGAIKRIYTSHPEIRSLRSFTLYDQIRTRISREYANYTYNWTTLGLFCDQYGISQERIDSSQFALLPVEHPDGGANGDVFCAAWFIKSLDGKLLQVLVAEIDSAALSGLFPNIQFLSGEAMMLVDALGQSVYRQGKADFEGDGYAAFAEAVIAGGLGETVRFGGTYYRVFVSDPLLDGLRVMRFLPGHAFDGIIHASQPGIVAMMLICLILSIAVLVWLIYRFTRPLRQLAESMKQAGGGEFGRLIPTSSSDVEIRPVIDQFNTMTTLINQLFNETYRLKLEQQRAELRALQAQINPHFLYNTLQTIHFMALKRNAYEISAIVDSLGSILRYCLKFGEDEVPLEAEIQNISQYLTVQKMRFLRRLSTHLDVDERVKDVMIPKMILQPLVENCIVHGVQDSAKSCTIRISCFLKGEQVVIEVRDDGPGIPEARLLDIRRSLDAAEGDQSDDHIGVINCYLRLKYFFQGKAEFEIESMPGCGTLVRIGCPARRV